MGTEVRRAQRPMRSQRPFGRLVRRHWSTAVAYLVVILVCVFVLIPILAGFVTAFKPGPIQIASPPVWLFQPTLDNFQRVLIAKNGLLNLRNSIIVTVLSITVSLLVAVPAAYSLARLRMKGRQQLLGWIISLRMIPPVVVALPFFVLIDRMKLYDTYVGLSLTYLSFSIPMIIWIMRGYFARTPHLEESAMVDGCSRLQAVLRVLLPVVMPGLAATALLVAMVAWNEYMLALILTGRNTATLPIGAVTYVTRVRVEWGELFAMNLIIAAPVLLLAATLHRHLVRGLTFGMVE